MAEQTLIERLIDSIKTVFPYEIEDDKRVVPNGFILAPFMVSTGLNGDGAVKEEIEHYQIDFFEQTRTEIVQKGKTLRTTIDSYGALATTTFRYENTVKLWRGTLTIEISNN